MSRRKRQPPHPNHERWLVSYADFITLLFAVFVVMYAASQTDQRKIGKLSLAIQVAFQDLGLFQASTTRAPIDDSEPMPFSDVQMVGNIDRTISVGTIAPNVGAQPGVSAGHLDQALREKLSKELAPEILKKQVELREGPDGLVLSLHEMGFYAPGSDTLIDNSRGTLDKVASVLAPGGFAVRIEGHTDNVPIHNARFDSNWELSSARATGLVRVFLERYKFEPARLSAAGYGEYHPVRPNSTAEGRAVNRRVDLVIQATQAIAHKGTKAPPLGIVAPPSPPLPQVFSSRSR